MVAGIDVVGIDRPTDGDENQEADYDLLDGLADQMLLLVSTSREYRPNVAQIAYRIGENDVRTEYHVDVML